MRISVLEKTFDSHWSARIKHSLDSPLDGMGFNVNHERGLLLAGWVLVSDSLSQVFLVVRYSGVTRSYPLNIDRPDVVSQVLAVDPAGHPLLRCGFHYEMPMCGDLEVGFYIDGSVVWLCSVSLGFN